MSNFQWSVEVLRLMLNQLSNQVGLYCGGIFFFRVSPTVEEPFLKQLSGYASTGAGVIGSKRSLLTQIFNEYPSAYVAFILENAPAQDEDIPVVIVQDYVFQPDSEIDLEFAVAHEIGHVANGDMLAAPIPKGDDVEYLRREMNADRVACLFLKDIRGAHKTLNYVLKIGQSEAFVEGNPDLDQKQLLVDLDIINKRIDFIKSMSPSCTF